MSDIIREVDEELRREKWEETWKKYGKLVIGLAVAIVLATAGGVGWREYSKSERLAQGDRFAAALSLVENSEKAAENAEVMAAFSEDAAEGYATLARFREAKFRADAGDAEAAIALYDALAEDSGVEPLFRGVATLYSVRLQIGAGDRAALTERLRPLTGEENPWRYTARELTAILALTDGDTQAARDLYRQLADDIGTPQSLKARAAEMLRTLPGQG